MDSNIFINGLLIGRIIFFISVSFSLESKEFKNNLLHTFKCLSQNKRIHLELVMDSIWASYSEVCITSVSAPFPPHKISLNRNSPGLESQRAHRMTCCCQSGIHHPCLVGGKRIRYLNSSDNSNNLNVLSNIIVSLSSFKLFIYPYRHYLHGYFLFR